MRCRLVGLLIITVIVFASVIVVGCGSSQTTPEITDESASSVPIEECYPQVPSGVEILTDEDGREYWDHGDHIHYLDEYSRSSEKREISSSTNILKFCEDNNIPVDCVAERFNVEEDMLDTSAGKFSSIMGFELFDIKQLVNGCR